MIKTVAVMSMLLSALYQGPDLTKTVFTNPVYPTKIVTDPAVFIMKQTVSVKASFQQQQIVCTATKNRSDGIVLKLYDEKDVSGEPTWNLDPTL